MEDPYANMTKDEVVELLKKTEDRAKKSEDENIELKGKLDTLRLVQHAIWLAERSRLASQTCHMAAGTMQCW